MTVSARVSFVGAMMQLHCLVEPSAGESDRHRTQDVGFVAPITILET